MIYKVMIRTSQDESTLKNLGVPADVLNERNFNDHVKLDLDEATAESYRAQGLTVLQSING